MAEGRTLFERACRGERGERVPVWIMRQAGRYLPEYRTLRAGVDFLTATKTPEIAAEITLQPMRRFAVDAAIQFADIMTPLEAMGVPVEFSPGPVIAEPLRSRHAIRSLRAWEPDADNLFVADAVRIVRGELSQDRAVIGFAGAPFTLLCYLVEGGGSKDFMTARSFLRTEPEVAGELLDRLGASMIQYLAAQARAGADALMLFDSWSGLLGPADYARHVLPVLRRTIAGLKAEVDRPIIYYARGAAPLLDHLGGTGADVLGLDWTAPLSEAIRALGPGSVLQGNLDPAALFASRSELGREIDAVLREGAGAAAHIFNLGHGIHHQTDPDQLAFLVDRVARSSIEAAAAS